MRQFIRLIEHLVRETFTESVVALVFILCEDFC